jgi:SAM-dependent methyltransferase
MSPVFKDHFSSVADAYRTFRPDYPEALFEWLAKIAPRREAALDCGCGSGQAAMALARHFAQVYAVDPSAKQIDHAIRKENVVYRVAPAEATGLPGASQDLIIAAQAFHWFDLDLFYPEVRRLARGGAVFAAFTYGLMTVNQELDPIIRHLYHDLLGQYWPPERLHVESGYRTLPFPFHELVPPALAMTAHWRADHLLGYLSTWSAVKECKVRTGKDPLQGIDRQLREAWGDPEGIKCVSWPLVIRAGRIG